MISTTTYVRILTATIILLALMFANMVNAQDDLYQIDELAQTPYRNGFVNSYFFQNTIGHDSEYLFVYIDGSGAGSALGRKSFFRWRSVTFGYYFYKYITLKYDFFIPEKPDTKPGKVHRKNEWNIDHRISGYATAINSFLDARTYENIILIGFSEGGAFLPELYFRLNKKEAVKGMILISSGVLSLYECFFIQRNNFSLPHSSEVSLKKIESLLHKSNRSKKEEEWLNYYTYNSTRYINDIDIPILLLHGEKDTNCPVESSRYIVNEFHHSGKQNLSYIEYKDMDHGFNGKIDVCFEDIRKWFVKNMYHETTMTL
jgi:pimeloyl-ACP methyl ester carboxylesterase